MRNLKGIFSLILIISIAILSCGCEEKETQITSEFYMYYVDELGVKLNSEPYTLTETQIDKQIMEIITKLEENGTIEDNYSAIPDTVTINGYNFTDGMVVIDFADDYMFIDKQREVLGRAATVISLCQLEQVEYVAFTVNDEPYMADGVNVLGAMSASDFVINTDEVANNALTTDVVLYFASNKGDELIKYDIKGATYGNKNIELFLVEQLVKGPSQKGYIPTLSPRITINSVVTANNICYVDFGENFLTEQSNVTNEIVIYSIVNTLTELPGIYKVQISVEGESAIKYHDEISLNDPFTRNLDKIKK